LSSLTAICQQESKTRDDCVPDRAFAQESAEPSGGSRGGASLVVLTHPDTDLFADVAQGSPTMFFLWQNPIITDVFFGPIPYGQIIQGPQAFETNQVSYIFDIALPAPGGAPAFLTQDGYFASVPNGTLPDPLVPLVGTPTAPTINDTSAYAALTGVGVQPVIAWAAPTLGTPTRYDLLVSAATGTVQPGEVVSFSAVLYTMSALKLPPGVLQGGCTYFGSITSTISADTLATPVLRSASSHSMSTDFGLFQPD
jgi:hypothetical protein